MKKFIILFSIAFIFNFCKKEEEVDDAPDIPVSWTKTFGGTGIDEGISIQQTTDGGYIITGKTYLNGNFDVYLIKTDEIGTEQWYKTFGGTESDLGFSVQQTIDGGFIITGCVESFGNGGYDVYLIKTDGSGVEQWNKTFGGSNNDIGNSVQQTTGGGYIICGSSSSFGNGNYDAYLIKTDGSGVEQWNKTFGGTGIDEGLSIQQTTDGGYIITGKTYLNGNFDIYLIKTDEIGTEQWYKTFGGTGIDEGYSVQQTTDGGYIITGYTTSFGSGQEDVYLIKTDENGEEEWYNTFGGTEYDLGFSVQQTTDGGFIITGCVESFGNGGYDVYLIKTDDSGVEQWNKTFGNISRDYGNSVKQTSDGGYIICGYTTSFGSGQEDVYLIKTDENGNVSQ